MPRRPADDTKRTSRGLLRPPARAPRAMEALAARCLRADADDARLGDLSEQYVRHHRHVRQRLGGVRWAMALSHLVADVRYLVAAANVALFARALDPGVTLAAPADAQHAAPVPLEETMVLARIGAAPGKWLQGALLATAIAFLAGGVIDLWTTWRQAEAMIVGLQRAKAEAAAAQIEQLVGAVRDRVAWSMDNAAGTPEQRRLDSLRLLRQVQELTEVVHLDADGRELLRVSRFARDTVGSGTDYTGDVRYIEARKRRTYVGAVYHRNAAEPHVSIALARNGGNAGIALAEMNLRGVADTIRSVRSGETGYAFLVDGSGRLVTGPDARPDGQRPDASPLVEHDSGEVRTGLTGVPVLSASAAVPTPGWRVVVELPIAEARRPLWNALMRGMGVLGLGLAAVLLASVAARRRTVPAAPAAT